MPRPFFIVFILIFPFCPLLSFTQEIWINAHAQTWILNSRLARVSLLGTGGKLGLEWENLVLSQLGGGLFISSTYFIPSTNQGTLWNLFALGSLHYTWKLSPIHGFGPYLNCGYGLGVVCFPKNRPSNFGTQIISGGGIQYQYFFHSQFSLGLAMGINGIFENQSSYFNPEINLMARIRVSGSKNEPQL